MVYLALVPLMRTPRLPAVDWTDAPADLNGLVRFAERRNLVSARVPSHFNLASTTLHMPHVCRGTYLLDALPLATWHALWPYSFCLSSYRSWSLPQTASLGTSQSDDDLLQWKVKRTLTINVTQIYVSTIYFILKQGYMFRLKVSHLQALTTFFVTRCFANFGIP